MEPPSLQQLRDSYQLLCSKPPPYQTPVSFFFDNSASNFDGCGSDIVRIKVDETDGTDEATAVRSEAVDRRDRGVAQLGAATPEAEVLRKTCDFMISLGDYAIYYDPRAGITAEQFDCAIGAMRAQDFVFLDFDRALTVFEGFLFSVPDWTSYLFGARSHFELSPHITEDDLILAQLGGPRRADMVAAALHRIIDKCGAHKVYVLTNNVQVGLITGAMQWLSKRGDCSEPFAAEHVVSTHFTGLDCKAAVMQQIIELTAKDEIGETLACWSANACRWALEVRSA